QPALPGGRLRAARTGLVGRGSRRRRAARAGPAPLWARGGRTAAALAGVVAVVRVAGPRGRALRPSPGTRSAEGSAAEPRSLSLRSTHRERTSSRRTAGGTGAADPRNGRRGGAGRQVVRVARNVPRPVTQHRLRGAFARRGSGIAAPVSPARLLPYFPIRRT